MAKIKVDTSKGPDPKSERSNKRKARGFKSVELSTRKGRRAEKRTAIACTIKGQRYAPGSKAGDHNEFTAGGSRQYHTS